MSDDPAGVAMDAAYEAGQREERDRWVAALRDLEGAIRASYVDVAQGQAWAEYWADQIAALLKAHGG